MTSSGLNKLEQSTQKSLAGKIISKKKNKKESKNFSEEK